MPSDALRLLVRPILLIVLFVTASAAQNRQVNGSKKEKRPWTSAGRLMIIDAHTHTDFSGKPGNNRGVPITQKQYFEAWRRAGVVGAVAHTHSEGEPSPDLRDRNVMSCIGIDAHPNASLIEDGLRSGRYGCIKIYLGYVHQYAYDKNYEPAYELAEKYDVPVVFHTGDTDSTRAKLKFADPLTIDEVAVDHPKVRFVIAH